MINKFELDQHLGCIRSAKCMICRCAYCKYLSTVTTCFRSSYILDIKYKRGTCKQCLKRSILPVTDCDSFEEI